VKLHRNALELIALVPHHGIANIENGFAWLTRTLVLEEMLHLGKVDAVVVRIHFAVGLG